MMKQKDLPEFELPRQLLTQLNECSNGGYILLNFSNNGDPRVYVNSDNTLNFMALLQHGSNYITAMNQLGIMETMQSIAAQDGETKKRRKRNEN